MSPTTLEYRINHRLLTGIVTLVIVFGVSLGALLFFDLNREFDRSLESQARAIVALYRQQPPAGDLRITMKDDGQPSHLAIRLRDGSIREPSGPLQLGPDLLEGTPRLEDVTLEGGRAGRQVEIAFLPESSPGATQPLITLIVAEPLEPLYWKMFYVALVLSAFLGALLLALVLLVRRSLQRGLEPIVGLKRQLKILDLEHSASRVNLLDPPRELIPVVRRINQLLRRTENLSPSSLLE
jgi:hypothetical protein